MSKSIMEALKYLREARMYNETSAEGKTTQDIEVEITFKDDFVVKAEEAEKINDKIIDIIEECISNGDIDDDAREYSDYDECLFNEKEDEEFKKGEKFPFTLKFHITIQGKWTGENATSWEPAWEEFEEVKGWISKIDEVKLDKEIRKIENFGDHIDSIKVVIYDHDQDYEIDYEKMEDDYWNGWERAQLRRGDERYE